MNKKVLTGKFYIVITSDTVLTTHDTKEGAVAAASLSANKHNSAFFVMEAVASVEPKLDVTVKEL